MEASSIYFEPVRSNTYLSGKTRKGTKACPAVLKQLANSFVVNAPFDLHLRCSMEAGQPTIKPVLDNTSITTEKLQNVFSISPRSDWLDERYPVFQITTPYVFFSNQKCDIVQNFPRQKIGTDTPFRLVEGRFSIDTWLRPLSWAAEWVRPECDIQIRRGDPWFDITFVSKGIDDSYALKKYELSERQLKQINANKDVTSYIKGTMSLMRRK